MCIRDRFARCSIAMSEKPVIRVVVIDDHEMFLQSVVRLLQEDPEIVVVGTALTAMEGFEITQQERPGVVIIDYHLPDMDAPNAIRTLREVHPAGRIITLTGTEPPGGLYASMRAGSSAWVRKTKAIQTLRDTVWHVAAGLPVANDEMESLPIVELATGRIAGFESLIRWQYPERGLLYPDSFLPLAEEIGFIAEIDQWACMHSICQLGEWQKRFASTPRLWMSVNLSASDLSSLDFLESFSATVIGAGIDPTDLMVEITESVLLGDTERTMDILTRLKGLGVGLALDDFGPAY